MVNPLHLIGRALLLWWRNWISLLFLNVLWFLLLIPLVTGPPATAALYAICQRIATDEVWDMGDLWREFRRLFWPAWRWALPNLLITAVIAANFYFYGTQTGTFWLVSRLVWGGVALVWLIINLFYWPFWLAQDDQSWRTTIINSGRFLLRHGVTALILTCLSVATLWLGIRLVIPFILGVVGWVVLMSHLAVQAALRHVPPSS